MSQPVTSFPLPPARCLSASADLGCLEADSTGCLSCAADGAYLMPVGVGAGVAVPLGVSAARSRCPSHLHLRDAAAAHMRARQCLHAGKQRKFPPGWVVVLPH